MTITSIKEARSSASAGDVEAIGDVLRRWSYGRDQAKWEQLSSCYHPDATMSISWFSGPAATFIERSKAMTAARRVGETTKHLLGIPMIEQLGDRAISECDVTIIVRANVDEVAVDTTAYARFVDCIEKRDRKWRLVSRTAVYEHDRVDPVAPDPRWPSVYSKFDFAGIPEACKHLGASMRLRGRTLSPDIVAMNTDAEERLKDASREWLVRG